MYKLLLGLALVAAVAAHGDHSHGEAGHSHDDDVLVLDAASFDSTVAQHQLMMVEFFAPWCGHCKKLAPEYASAAHQLMGIVPLASVDCTIERDLCGKYDVKGFPTVKLFRNDGSAPTDYQGPRVADGIVQFLKKQKAPAYVVLSDQSSVEDFRAQEEIVIVAQLSAIDSAEAVAYLKAVNALRNEYSFGVQLGAATPKVTLYKKFDDPKVDMTGDITTEAVTKFVIANSFPLVGEIGPENFQKYVDRGFPLVWIFVDFSAAVTTSVLETAAVVARDFQSSLSFVKLDGVRWVEHAKNFGLSGATPGIVIEDRIKRKNYIYTAASVEAGSLRAHAQGFLDGTLTANVKSEEIPASNNEPVKVVVGKTFDAIVLDASKDVFVEFYAPWCGHCKTLAPKWEQLATELASEKSVVIAKVDATANDTPADVQGFPTLILYPANDKTNPITYQGDRTTSAMAEFVRSHLSGSRVASDAGSAGRGTHDEL